MITPKWRDRRLLVVCAIVAFPGCWDHPAEVAGGGQFAMTLEEVGHWPMPSRADLVGGSIVDSATVLAWNHKGDLWLLEQNHTLPQHLGVRAIPSINRARGGVLLLAREDGSLAKLSADGMVVQMDVRCPEAKTARLLLAHEGGFVAVFPAADDFEEVRGFSVTSTSCEARGEPLRMTAAEKVTLALARGQEIIASSSDPFRPLLKVTLGDGEPVVSEIPESRPQAADILGPSRGAKWVALPVVPLDRGFLRVSADLRSDRRRVDRWDSAGIHLNTTEVEGAFGFFTSAPEHRLLLGMRMEGRPEVVLYRWTWED